MAPAAKNSKPIFKTSSPFTDTKWPTISHNDQEIILDLACNLLAPVGEHRKTHVHPSRGKKRKRSENSEPPPSPPEIGSYLLVGINSVTRHLEALVAESRTQQKTADHASNIPKPNPGKSDHHAPEHTEPKEEEQKEEEKIDAAPYHRPLSMVLITHPNPATSLLHAHLPTLVHLSTLQTNSSSSSLATTTAAATRLVPLPTSADARLASNLHIPRVGAIGILEDAPGTKGLQEYVRKKVEMTESKWIDEAMKAEWKGLNVRNEAMELCMR